MSDSWFQEKFANLQIEDQRMDGLSQIHDKLQTLNQDEIAQVITHSQIQLSTVFSCLERESSQQTTVACDILSLCLSSLELNNENGNVVLLEDMIKHPNDAVKMIGLTQLERVVRKNPDQTQSMSIVVDVVKCLELPSTPIGTMAMKILVLQLAKHFLSSEVRAAVEAAMNVSSTSKCRVYEVIVGISLASAQNMRLVESILEKIIADLASEDILLQLNAMEILSNLVAKEYGLAYLEEQGLFPRLMSALENIDMMHILFPGFIKFFGSVANSHPEKIFTKFSNICKPLFETIIANDSATLSPCLETLGVLGRSKDGKVGLSGLNLVCPEGDMKMILMEMAVFLTTLPTEEQIRILNCLELLFRLQPEPDHDVTMNPDNRICTITETWYRYLDRGPGLKIVLNYIRNPFPDIKLAGYGVLKAITDYPWGRVAIADTAGLLEFILDRSSDTNTEALQAKYEILLALNRFNESFSETQQQEIKDYISRGAFYKKGVTEVAVEGGQ